MTKQTFAYLRVSKLDQDREQNKLDLLKLANEAHLGQVQFIEEAMPSRVPWHKRQIAVILEQASEGDALVVSELFHLGRSTLECMEILARACEKGIHVYAVKGHWHLGNSIPSKGMAMGFVMAAEIERDLISQRTTESLAARKQKGLPLGRPKGAGPSRLDGYQTEIEMYFKGGASLTWIARKCKTSRRNLSHWLKQHGIDPNV